MIGCECGSSYDETWNSSTHGLGIIVAAFGLAILWMLVREKPAHLKWSVMLYAASLLTMYCFSTIFHTTCLFEPDTLASHYTQNLDYAGIFILTAGTYTPLLVVKFHGEVWAYVFLAVIWAIGIIGIGVVAFYEGVYRLPVLYTIFVCLASIGFLAIGRIANSLGYNGFKLIFVGGIIYAIGVPFNLRNAHEWGFPDHTIWHIFVMIASSFHFHAIRVHIALQSTSTASDVECKKLLLDA